MKEWKFVVRYSSVCAFLTMKTLSSEVLPCWWLVRSRRAYAVTTSLSCNMSNWITCYIHLITCRVLINSRITSKTIQSPSLCEMIAQNDVITLSDHTISRHSNLNRFLCYGNTLKRFTSQDFLLKWFFSYLDETKLLMTLFFLHLVDTQLHYP